MKNEKYSKEYSVKVLTSDSAWSNDSCRERVQSGELEKIAENSEGFVRLWKGVEGKYQVTCIMDNFDNSLSLMKKFNEISYVREVSIAKEDLKLHGRYIGPSLK